MRRQEIAAAGSGDRPPRRKMMLRAFRRKSQRTEQVSAARRSRCYGFADYSGGPGQEEKQLQGAIVRHARLKQIQRYGREWTRQRLVPLHVEFKFKDAYFNVQVSPLVIWLLLHALGAPGFLEIGRFFN